MRPDSLRVLGERLRRGERASGQQRERTTCSREEGAYQTACQRRSHGHTHLILLSQQESKKCRVRMATQVEGFRISGHVNSSVVLSNRKMKARLGKLFYEWHGGLGLACQLF